MTLTIKGKVFDTMKEACERLEISRPTMLRYLADGYFSPAKRHRQGRGKEIRYFDSDWYAQNEPKLIAARQSSPDSQQPGSP
jgi:predicted site-specific integrase-resolvase